ncbi:hypothetical protein [Candidatus Poriferisodalis sp.]|uniref:tyrosine-protein kinase family protein n=1 Tax=Candidatus Poriferisodalis sp. TaxID=3101277 RepID=UPI003AF8EEB4
MLTIYSTYGSPGASTTAVYLAASWASKGSQVLLIEADAASGSMGQKLGMQFTPGTASFVASGKPTTAENLIEHAQDVLFSDLHIMPAPPSPVGAQSVAQVLATMGDSLRDISDSDMAVVIDGGRLTSEASASQLTTCAAGVLVVSRENTQLSSLEHLGGVFAADPSEAGPEGLSLCVSASPFSEDEWREQFGLAYVGSIDLARGGTTDLSMFMSRGKRSSRKLRHSLDKIADRLYEHAHPGAATTSRPRRRPAEPTAPAHPQGHPPPAHHSAEPSGQMHAEAGDAHGQTDYLAQPLTSSSYAGQEFQQMPPQHHGGDNSSAMHIPPVGYPAGGTVGGASWPEQAGEASGSSISTQPPDVGDVPATPSGSFRSWAAMLHGAEAEGHRDVGTPPVGGNVSA